MRIDDPGRFGKVAVMYGGTSAEREVSLNSGACVLAALQRAGVDAFGFDPAETPLVSLPETGCDRVWIALHGTGGEDGVVQGALESLGLPYTGSGVLGSALAMDKVRSKMLFSAAGLSTPAWRTAQSHAELVAAIDVVGLPCIVKPAAEGSSVGIARVERATELGPAWQAARASGGPVLIERLIVGDEYTAGVMGRDVLPLIRIETPHVLYDYDAKYHSSTTQYHCPCGLSAASERDLAAQSLAAFDVLAVSGWGRVDFMLDSDGVAQILEVNTIPGMTAHSLVPKAAAQAGIDFDTLVWRVLETSFDDKVPG